ncbi:MAG: DUF4214 domain-containing protein [Pseudomonadota bacterium]
MSTASDLERQMADLVNAARAAEGLAPLQLELDLNEAAEDHSSWMLAQNVFSHTGAGGSSAGARMQDAGFTFSGSWSWGENIAVQSERGAPGIEDDVEDLFVSLWNSPGHRANMLNPNFDYIGIGVEVGNFTYSQGTYYSVIVTQKFAKTGASVNLDTGGGSAGDNNPPQDEPPAAAPPPQEPDQPTSPPGSSGVATINGTNRDDILVGSDGQSELDGRRGDDFLFADGYGDNAYDTASGQVVRLFQATLNRSPDDEGHSFWTNALLNGTSLSQIASGFVGSAEFQTIYGGLNDQQFVTLMYDNVLDRSPDPSGEAAWLNLLSSGASRADVVLGFSESAEFVQKMFPKVIEYSKSQAVGEFTDEVVRLYQATLDRLPDVAGYTSWTEALANGMDYSVVVNGFVGSAEFQSVYGTLTNAQFVTLMYDNVLDRTPDSAGASFWLGSMAGGTSRAEVVAGFAESLEFQNKMAPVIENWAEGLGTDDVLDGGVGDDVLVGGMLADEFYFSRSDGGDDRVLDFEMWDTIVLQGFGLGSASAAAAAFVQDGNDAVYDHVNGEIRLVDVVAADLTSDEFQIA